MENKPESRIPGSENDQKFIEAKEKTLRDIRDLHAKVQRLNPNKGTGMDQLLATLARILPAVDNVTDYNGLKNRIIDVVFAETNKSLQLGKDEERILRLWHRKLLSRIGMCLQQTVVGKTQADVRIHAIGHSLTDEKLPRGTIADIISSGIVDSRGAVIQKAVVCRAEGGQIPINNNEAPDEPRKTYYRGQGRLLWHDLEEEAKRIHDEEGRLDWEKEWDKVPALNPKLESPLSQIPKTEMTETLSRTETNPERERIVAVARTYFADLNAEGPDFKAYDAESDSEKKEALGKGIKERRVQVIREVLNLPGFLDELRSLSAIAAETCTNPDKIFFPGYFEPTAKMIQIHKSFPGGKNNDSYAGLYSEGGPFPFHTALLNLLRTHGLTEEDLKEMQELEWIKKGRKALEGLAKAVDEYERSPLPLKKIIPISTKRDRNR